MKRKAIAVLATLVLTFSMSSCNGYATAEKVNHVVAVIITLAEGDIPAFQAAGAINAQEVKVIENYLSTVSTLNSQYGSCVDNANNAKLKTNGKFLACLNIFLQGATDPQELAQFRILNPKAQQRVQLWVAAIQLGINTAIAALGGTTQQPVQIAPVSTPSAELEAFKIRVMEGM